MAGGAEQVAVLSEPKTEGSVDIALRESGARFQAAMCSVVFEARQTPPGTGFSLDSHLTSAQTATVSTPGDQTGGHVSY